MLEKKGAGKLPQWFVQDWQNYYLHCRTNGYTLIKFAGGAVLVGVVSSQGIWIVCALEEKLRACIWVLIKTFAAGVEFLD